MKCPKVPFRMTLAISILIWVEQLIFLLKITYRVLICSLQIVDQLVDIGALEHSRGYPVPRLTARLSPDRLELVPVQGDVDNLVCHTRWGTIVLGPDCKLW